MAYSTGVITLETTKCLYCFGYNIAASYFVSVSSQQTTLVTVQSGDILYLQTPHGSHL